MVTDKIHSLQKYDCDVCGITVKKKNTRVQKGLRRCKSCIDDIKNEGKNTSMRWGSPRANSDTTTAVYDVTVFDITAAGGITPSHSVSSELTRGVTLGLANLPARIFFGSSFFMVVQGSGGAIDITANPQIAAGSNGDILCLKGNSDVNTLTIDNGTGVVLTGGVSFVLRNNDTLVLAYNGTNWVENSRSEN